MEKSLKADMEKLLKAAKVIALTPETRMYLMQNDPKALEQLDAAIYDAPGDRDYDEQLANCKDQINSKAMVVTMPLHVQIKLVPHITLG